jgi:hypothetical protein
VEIRKYLCENFEGYSVTAVIAKDDITLLLLCADPQKDLDVVFTGSSEEMEPLMTFVLAIIEYIGATWDEREKTYRDLPQVNSLERFSFAMLSAFSDIPVTEYAEMVDAIYSFTQLDVLLRAFGAASELAQMYDATKATSLTQIFA